MCLHGGRPRDVQGSGLGNCGHWSLGAPVVTHPEGWWTQGTSLGVQRLGARSPSAPSRKGDTAKEVLTPGGCHPVPQQPPFPSPGDLTAQQEYPGSPLQHSPPYSALPVHGVLVVGEGG